MDRFLIVCLFIFTSSLLQAQTTCESATVDISNKVKCNILYELIYKDYFWSRFANVYNEEDKFIAKYHFTIRRIRYHLPRTNIDIYPLYSYKTRNLAEYLKTQAVTTHDSIIYEHLKRERRPSRYSESRGGVIHYKVSPLKKWQGKYPYIDVEQIQLKREDEERNHTISRYRLLWVDSCQYEFSVQGFAYKRDKYLYDGKGRTLSKSRRCVRRNFKRLVETVYVREEDELIELKPAE